MAVEFERIEESECLLCGSRRPLTGEHKIKASLIRREFKGRRTVFSGKAEPKIAQGPKSKTFHFNAKICDVCNSASTQLGDVSFDNLHTCLKEAYDKGTELTDAFGIPNCPYLKDDHYFRYFAKLLCCFLAEVGGPRSKSLASFATGLSNRNPVHLSIKKDDEYLGQLIDLGTQGYAAHGGLTFRFDESKRWVRSIESSLSVGGIRYEFWVQLSWLSKLELHFLFRDIVATALTKISDD
jgi:hypothetical protein